MVLPPARGDAASGPDRTLVVEGLVNARDLGGLRRRDGSTTPRGVFFRSEAPERVGPRGWAALRSAGVRTVVDLRRPDERARDRSPRPDWLTTRCVDIDGVDEHPDFWAPLIADHRAGTALYYLPHLRALPHRSGAALSAITSAPPGGVLFHCAAGRDRTGVVAMLLLLAADAEPEEVVADYLETVRRGPQRGAAVRAPDPEPAVTEALRAHGTTTEGAFRAALAGADLPALLAAAGTSPADRRALLTWRGSL